MVASACRPYRTSCRFSSRSGTTSATVAIATRAKASSRKAREIFEAAASRELHLALATMPTNWVRGFAPEIVADAETVLCLRSVMMKPEHRDWIDRIAAILDECAASE